MADSRYDKMRHALGVLDRPAFIPTTLRCYPRYS